MVDGLGSSTAISVRNVVRSDVKFFGVEHDFIWWSDQDFTEWQVFQLFVFVFSVFVNHELLGKRIEFWFLDF